jgi:hypothetical protein
MGGRDNHAGAPRASALPPHGGRPSPCFPESLCPAAAAMPPSPGLGRSQLRDFRKGDFPMHMDIILIQPLVALLIGILILIVPRLLNYLIAIYLIFVGLVGLFPHLFTQTHI